VQKEAYARASRTYNQDYIGILKRRLWLVLLSTLVFLGAASHLHLDSAQYVETLVLVEQQKVPTDYVTRFSPKI